MSTPPDTPAILVIEDEPLISMMIEDFLDTLGYRLAGSADNVAEALVLIAAGGFDAVLLDVNLRNGEPCWPIADALAARKAPFVLATGGNADAAPPQHANAPMLAKPYTMDGLQGAFDALLGTRAL